MIINMYGAQTGYGGGGGGGTHIFLMGDASKALQYSQKETP